MEFYFFDSLVCLTYDWYFFRMWTLAFAELQVETKPSFIKEGVVNTATTQPQLFFFAKSGPCSEPLA